MITVSIALAVSLAAPANTPEFAPGTASRWLVILGGGATRAEADAFVATFSVGAASSFKPAAGHPKAVRSDSIVGLKPGFEIAVLGACDDKALAEAVRDLASLSMDGVYLREVMGVPSSCPAFNSETPRATSEPQRLGARASASALEYVVGTSSLDDAVGRDQANACEVRALDVSLIASATTIAHESLYGCETLCSDHGEVPADAVCGADAVAWTFDERVVAGDRAWLALVEDERHTRTRGREPAAKSRWHLYGYACGSLKSVLTINLKAEDDGAAWSARSTSKDGKRVEVFAPSGKAKRFVWNDATCGFVPSK